MKFTKKYFEQLLVLLKNLPQLGRARCFVSSERRSEPERGQSLHFTPGNASVFF